MLTKFLSKEEEPLRRYVYGVGVGVLTLLVVLGVITDEVAYAIGGFLSLALLVPAVEVARSKVDSPATSAAKDAVLAEYTENDFSDYEPRHAAGE